MAIKPYANCRVVTAMPVNGSTCVNLNRVWLTAIGYNTRAVRAYERVGFKHEGVLRQAILRDGEHYDGLVMGLLREEWERLPDVVAGRQKKAG